MKRYLAVDIGASSGRHIVGWTENGERKTEELHRFPNGVTELDGHLTWDIDALVGHVRSRRKNTPRLRACLSTPGVWTTCS